MRLRSDQNILWTNAFGWTDGNWAHADRGDPYNVTVPAYRVGPWHIIKP